MVREYPEELLLERVFFYTVKIMQRGHGSPADENGGGDVRFGIGENAFKLVPIGDGGKIHLLDGCARDDHAVEMLVFHVAEGLIKLPQISLRRVPAVVAFRA